MLIAGIDRRYNLTDVSGIPSQWENFWAGANRLPARVQGVIYGLCYDLRPDGFAYLSGVEVTDASELPEGFRSENIPARHYAVFLHQGPLSEIGETIHAIWEEWLPASGRQVAMPPFVLERCGETIGAEVWLPIQA